MTWLRLTGRKVRPALLPVVVAVAAAMVGTPARAAYLASFSGNTQPYHNNVQGPGVGGTVNFAVYDTTGGSAGDTWGTGVANFNSLFTAAAGSGALDTTAKYLYVYQTVNNGPSAGSFPISVNAVLVNPALVTSYGTFTGSSFSATVLGSPAGFGNPAADTTGATPGITTGQSGLNAPTVGLRTTSLVAIFSPEIAANSKSNLWAYTSNAAPIFAQTGLLDGGTTADGRVPTAVPEPSAALLSLIGLPFGLLLWRRLAGR
jgi:hypothetical protein